METGPPDMLQAGYVDMLVTKLSNKECNSAQEDAARQLARLSLFDANRCVIAKSPRALDALVGLLVADDVHEKVRVLIVGALENLAESQEYRGLLAARGVMDGLVPLLAENCSEALQSRAARTLMNSAMWPGFKSSIQKVPTALIVSLVRLLQRNVSKDIQLDAMRALVNLSSAPPNQLIIAAIRDHAFTHLAKLLKRNGCPVTQELAARILMSLALSVQNKDIQHWSGAIDGLVHLLWRDTYPGAQKFGAKALLNLTAGDRQAKLVVARFPGLLDGLLRLLEKSQDEALQIVAADTLRNLTCEVENVFHIAFFPGILQGVLQLLKRTPAMREAAVCALVNLSGALGAQIFIVLIPGAMQGLIELMSNDDNPRLQLLAAITMGNLTESSETINLIATHPGALQAIEGLFGNHLQPDAQQQAARSIANIAALCTVEILNQILPRILPTLVERIYQYEALYAPTHILRAFKYMARSSFNKIQISQHPGALEGIIRLASNEYSQDVQNQAKKALASFL